MISADAKLTVAGTPPGRFCGPCSGQDLSIAIELFGSSIDRFTSCDLAYRYPDVSAKDAVPDDWALISHVHGIDRVMPEKTTWYDGNRTFRPWRHGVSRITLSYWSSFDVI